MNFRIKQNCIDNELLDVYRPGKTARFNQLLASVHVDFFDLSPDQWECLHDGEELIVEWKVRFVA